MGAVTDVVVDQRLRDIQREYLEFLEDEVMNNLTIANKNILNKLGRACMFFV